MKKQGILGGTFNPIHSGHVELGTLAANHCGLDEIWMIPTGMPPHKNGTELVSGEHRLVMCRLAAEGLPAETLVSDMELKRAGRSYTYDTLRLLWEQDPETERYLILGADMFLSFHTWYRWNDILELAVLCTAPREEGTVREIQKYAEQNRIPKARYCCIPKKPVTVSSTQIRERVQKELPLTGLVPKQVEQYIAQHRLYQKEQKEGTM